MKTFEQFLNEAQRPAFSSQRDIKGAERYLQSPESKKAPPVHPVIARREAAEASQRTGPRGTTSSLAQQDIARQLAAQEAEQNAKQEKQNTLTQAAQRLAAQRANETEEQKATRIKAEKARARSARRAARKAQNS